LASVEAEPAPPPPVPPPPPPPPEPLPIGFRNPIAVRVALTAGALATLMSLIMGGPIFLVTSILGGAFAVFLYSRRTGETLSVINGARLGWISGLFGFLVLSVLVLLVVVQISQPEVATALREQMKKSPVP